MPRKPGHPPVVCQYFTWRLLLRDGVYYADGRGGKYNLGKHSLCTRNLNVALAQLKLLDHQQAVELGLASASAASGVADISIPEGWKLYLEFSGRSSVQGGTAPDTLKRYRAVRHKHVSFCARQGIRNWHEFDVKCLEKYGNWLAKRYADRTQYLELTLLKSVSGWLVSQKLLRPDSRLEYRLSKPQGTDTYCYSTEEVSAMVRLCESNANLAWLVPVIVILAHTGMRIGELAGLRWTDINLLQNAIRVADERASRRKRQSGIARTTKGRRSRIIPLHPTLKKLLLGMARHPDGYVAHALRGGRLRPRNVLQALIDNVINPLKDKFPTPPGEIGFEHGRLHSIRHFFCSQAFLGGASEGEIREWLGHADSKMVEHYRHLRSDDAQRKMAKIEFLSNSETQGVVA